MTFIIELISDFFPISKNLNKNRYAFRNTRYHKSKQGNYDKYIDI